MYRELQEFVSKKKPIALATVVEAGEKNRELTGQKLLLTESEVFGPLQDHPIGAEVHRLAAEALKQRGVHFRQITAEKVTAGIFVECYHPVARLLILGGGHVARPLVQIASLLQYQITVVDDRPTFANNQRFPGAAVVCDDFIPALQRQAIDPATSVVIVTRGHRHDLACLEYVLQFQPGYVGMIGSRRRVKLVKEHLARCGYPDEKVNRVHMPIGLAIGAATPEEIAVSIAAQLVEVRRGPGGVPTSTAEEWELLTRTMEYVNLGQPVVAATILRTRGSTPRKAGAKMLVLPDGTCIGTIGGGCGEAAVRRDALMLLDEGGVKISSVLLDAGTAAEEGMVCGGVMDVFLERLV